MKNLEILSEKVDTSMNETLFNGSVILVTGGTGSFGRQFVKMTLEKYKPKKLIVLSRDEMKQWDMAKLDPSFTPLLLVWDSTCALIQY